MPVLYKIVALAALLGALVGLHEWDKRVAVHKAEEVVILRLTNQYDKKLLEAIGEAQLTRDVIEAQSQKTIEEKDDKINSVNSKLAAALNSLHNRPTRSEQHSSNQEAPASCTGRELSREDAEFLTREAARANQVVVERDYFYNEYEIVRKNLDELRKKGQQ